MSTPNVGAVAMDVVLGQNTVGSVIKSTMSQCQKVISSSSATISEKISAIGKATTNIGEKLLPVSAAVGGIGIAAGKAALDFDDGMANINTLLDDTSHLSGYGDTIKSVSDETGISLKTVQDGMYQTISSIGDGGESTQKMFEIMSKSAKAGGSSVSDAVSLISAGMKGYNEVNDKTAQKISDLGFETAKLGVTTFPELAQSMQPLFPLGNSLSMSYEELFGTMATLTGVTGNTSEVTTQFKAVMSNCMKPTESMTKLLKQHGYESAQAAIKAKGLSGFIDMVKQSTGGSASKMAELFSSTEAVTAMTALCGGQYDNFKVKLGEMQKASGATNTAYGKMETKGDKLEKSVNKIKNSAENLGESLITVLAPILEDVSSAVSKVTKWFSSLSESQKETIVKIGLAVVAAGPMVIIFGKLTSAVGSTVSVFSKIGSSITHVVKASTSVSKLGSAASAAAAPVSKAAGGVGALSKNALGLVAAGAGILLAATGLTLLSLAAIKLAKAGTPAIACLGGMVLVLAGLAVGAAALAPALTAGAVGLVAFGAAVALVGVGVLAASAGMTLLAGQLPTITTYGMSAATAILALGAAMVVYSAGVIAATLSSAALIIPVGLLTLTILPLTLGVGALTIAVGLLDVAVGALAILSGIACGNISGAFTSMHNRASSAINGVKSAITSGLSHAFDNIKNMPATALQWGKDMINGIINGIKSCIGAVGDAVKSVADKIKGFLHFSVPDEGPLTDYESWMPDFMGGLSEGIDKNKYKVTDAVKGLTAEMSVTPQIQAPQIKSVASVQQSSVAQSQDNNKVAELLQAVIKKLDDMSKQDVSIKWSDRELGRLVKQYE